MNQWGKLLFGIALIVSLLFAGVTPVLADPPESTEMRVSDLEQKTKDLESDMAAVKQELLILTDPEALIQHTGIANCFTDAVCQLQFRVKHIEEVMQNFDPDEIIALEERVSDLEDRIPELDNRVDELERWRIQEVDPTLEDHEDRITALENGGCSGCPPVKICKVDCTPNTPDCSPCDPVTSLEVTVSGLVAKAGNFDKRLKALEAFKSQSEALHVELENRVSALESQVPTNTEDISSNRDDIKKNRDDVRKLRIDFENHLIDYNDFKNKTNQHQADQDEKIDELFGKYHDHEERLTTVERWDLRISDLEKDVGDLQQWQAQKVDPTLAEYGKQISDLEATVNDEHANRIQGLEDDLAHHKQAYNAHVIDFEQFEDATNSHLEDLDITDDQIKGRLEDLEERVAQVETHIVNLWDAIKKNERGISKNANDIGGLQGQIDDINEQLKGIMADLGDILNSELPLIKDDIKAINSTVSRLVQENEDQQSKIETLMHKVGILWTELNEIKDGSIGEDAGLWKVLIIFNTVAILVLIWEVFLNN